MNPKKRQKCDFCGYEFTGEEARSACVSCPVSSCDKLRCPNCGYEYLPVPRLVSYLKKRKKKSR